VRVSAFAKGLARISLYRRVAIRTPKWRYVGRGAPGERSEPQGVRGQRPRNFFCRRPYKTTILHTASLISACAANHACRQRGAGAGPD
jgi:hypothetical protein